MPSDVVGEVPCGAVTFVRILGKRLHHDQVDVAAYLAPHYGILEAIARAPWHFVEDEAPPLGIPQSRYIVRRLADDELIQDDAECVHVGGGRDDVARELLGCGVLRRGRSRVDRSEEHTPE